MSLWSLLPAAASTAALAMNKPKKSDYRLNTGYIKKYIASLRGRKNDRQVYNMAMRPMVKAIGQQTGRARRNIEASSARYGLSGSGIEAQQKLSANKAALSALTGAHEKAALRQQAENYRIDKSIDYAIQREGYHTARANLAFNQAKTQYRRNLTGGIVNLAAQGAAQIGQTMQNNRQAYNQARASGLLPTETTQQEFYDQAAQAGYKGDLANYIASLQVQNQDAAINAYNTYLASPSEENLAALKEINPALHSGLLEQTSRQKNTLINKIQQSIPAEQLPENLEQMSIPDLNNLLAPRPVAPSSPPPSPLQYFDAALTDPDVSSGDMTRQYQNWLLTGEYDETQSGKIQTRIKTKQANELKSLTEQEQKKEFARIYADNRNDLKVSLENTASAAKLTEDPHYLNILNSLNSLSGSKQSINIVEADKLKDEIKSFIENIKFDQIDTLRPGAFNLTMNNIDNPGQKKNRLYLYLTGYVDNMQKAIPAENQVEDLINDLIGE